jgi:hypothetical protein
MGRWRRRRAPAPAAGDVAVTIRYAYPDDSIALRRLAALDSAEVPADPVLVAEVGGQLRAAVSMHGGRAISDPFHPTLWLVELLVTRVAQLSQPSVETRRLGTRAANPSSALS